MTDNEEPAFAPQGIDLERPNAARIYDWFLGGTANWAIDREFGEKALKAVPHGRLNAHVNREFLGRAVTYAVRNGITQFLDLGSGVPTVGNVHQVADKLDSNSRCVYVDNEPVAVAHSKILLEENGDPSRHAVVNGDLRDVDRVWQEAFATGVLDPAKPIGLLMVAVLHFVSPEDGGEAAVARYRELLPPGSLLIMSHGTTDGVPPEHLVQLQSVHEQYKQSSTPVTLRTRAEFSALFGDFDLVEPGVVWLPEWRLDEAESEATAEVADNPPASFMLGGVARKG
ncbi:SAM-dependent methyltransferase [Amycolatopsis sp. YIM 10]|uniref:SAM-dependent methyltransferase n=1 Tax=Amycolatopsis sp. YIM 10 TaxID=2653857 RepID=UPI00129070CA|nr:SAM-dependent methyltransferase [Amycolatopsis sp. YIM 10]QFU85604.1 S-adenosyl methyltransferase [Amycolatopsis sp. YIM 10]